MANRAHGRTTCQVNSDHHLLALASHVLKDTFRIDKKHENIPYTSTTSLMDIYMLYTPQHLSLTTLTYVQKAMVASQ